MKINIPNLPAGLESGSFEGFRTEKYRANCVYNCILTDYIDSPLFIREAIQVELIRDKKAFQFLLSEGLSGDEMEEAFFSCRYGNYDSIPDYINGKLTPDCPNCGIEETCKGFNVVCKIPPLHNNLMLTARELQIVKLVTKGLFDKEIADSLDSSVNTVRTHLERIRKKMEVNSRIEIAKWGHKHNI